MTLDELIQALSLIFLQGTPDSLTNRDGVENEVHSSSRPTLHTFSNPCPDLPPSDK